MAGNKTKETQASVADYLMTIANEKKRSDSTAIIKLIAEAISLEPKMWGTSIVGFGSYDYKYDSGREGNAPLVGIAARVNAITLYLCATYGQRDGLLAKLGKYKTGKGCLYIQKLEDINTNILIEMIKYSIDHRIKLHADD